MNKNKTISTVMKAMLITAAPALTNCSTVSPAAPAAPTIQVPAKQSPAAVDLEVDMDNNGGGRKPQPSCGVRG